MKKVLLILGIIIFYFIIGKITTDTNLIPDEAIRIRVIANSDKYEDQKLKLEIKKQLEDYYYDLLKDVKGVENASFLIQKSIPNTEKIVYSILKNDDFDIHYGMNHFPQKEYKGVIYKEGDYESLVVTLGTGSGKNWWCVLFPPLCLLENNDMEEVEYRSFIADTIEKYF